jgi:hypothetical protein
MDRIVRDGATPPPHGATSRLQRKRGSRPPPLIEALTLSQWVERHPELAEVAAAYRVRYGPTLAEQLQDWRTFMARLAAIGIGGEFRNRKGRNGHE